MTQQLLCLSCSQQTCCSASVLLYHCRVMEGLSACECPVCFNLLGSECPPMSMPCGHTLCHPCVEQLSSAGARRAPTFRCPLCREWVNREAVILNVTLRDLIGEGYTFEQSFHHALLLWVLSVCMSSTLVLFVAPSLFVCPSLLVPPPFLYS